MNTVTTTPLDVLRQQGHCKHVFKDHAGRVCARGAINLAFNLSALTICRETGDYEHELARVIKANYPDCVTCEWADANTIAIWNNEAERTQDEVEAMMEKAEIGLGLR